MTDLPLVLVWGLKAAPLLIAAWLVTALLRRASAATRHFVWVLAIAGVLLLPAVTAVVPRWELAVLARTPATETRAIEGDQERSEARGAEPEPSGPSPSTTFDGVPSPSMAFDRPASPSIVLDRLSAVWALGAGVIVLLIALSLWRTNRLARGATPMAHAGVLGEAGRIARRLGVRRPVTILQAAGDAMPMTWGALRPRMLLPAEFADWPAARRQAVLVHELAHVKRLDWLTQLIARFAGALYWWNPLVWIAARRLREERELACDDLVLAHGTVASSYAGDLLEIARALRASPATALAGIAMARRSQLAGRLLAVLDGSRVRGPVGSRSAVAAVTAVAAVLFPLAAMAARDAGRPADRRTDGSVSKPEITINSAGPAAGSEVALTASPPVRLTAQQSRATLCDWSLRGGAKRSSSSTNIDDDRMTVKIVRDDCSLTVDSDGKIAFTPDDRDVASITGGGYFEIEEREGRNRRRVEIASEGGSLQRRWVVNGDAQPYGDDARAWLADVVLVLMRRAGFNAEARALRIFEQRGADGLIAEIDELQSDYVSAQYFSVLFARARLTAAQQTRLIENAAQRIKSDYELGRVLKALAKRGPLEAAVQRAYVRASDSLESDYEHRQALAALAADSDLDVAALDAMLVSARRIDSDYERAELLLATATRYPAGRALPPSYLGAVGSMDSDYERRRVLSPLLDRDRLSPADRAAVLAVLTGMDSDYERAEVLLDVIRGGPLDQTTRAPFFRAADAMDSDYERQRVLQAVVASRPDEATTLAVIASARDIDSDYSKAEVLVGVARRGLESAGVRQAYLAAADTIDSSYERDRVRRAAGLRGT
jgi:beta-lactamase regulating signal transducer with metallopeptidase domain